MTWTSTQNQMACAIAKASIKENLGIDSDLLRLRKACESSPEYACLTHPGACFVTLEKAGALRGCIGSLEAHQPLIDDICHNAVSAACRDPRFPAVSISELPTLTMSLSILTPPSKMAIASESDLLSQLVPGEDGLILSYGYHRATYLPSVWEQLPTPELFVGELKRKAGLDRDFWHEGVECLRYHVHYIRCGDLGFC